MPVAIAYLLLSTFLLTLPGSAIPKDNWFDRMWMDKWVHLVMFFVMVWVWSWAIQKRNLITKRALLTIGIISLLYGIAMEFVQHHFIPHRSYDPGDMIADAAGCVVGVVYCWGRYIKK